MHIQYISSVCFLYVFVLYLCEVCICCCSDEIEAPSNRTEVLSHNVLYKLLVKLKLNVLTRRALSGLDENGTELGSLTEAETRDIVKQWMKYNIDKTIAEGIIYYSQTGIKERCVWLDVHGFDLFANTNPDHMHDFLEGACYSVMYEVIKGLKEHIPTFSLSNLNARIKAFAFGPESNTPAEVNIVRDAGGGGRLRKMSANEVRVFVNYFGLLVGDLVPQFDEDDSTAVSRGRVVEKQSPHPAYKFYDLYLRLIAVQELIGCKRVSPPLARVLQIAVRGLNTAYMECTSRSHVPPKMHFLIHYSSAMLRNGPSLSLSTIGYERKHKELKRALTSIASNINTPLSAAKKIMLLVNALLTANELPPNTFIPGRVKSVLRYIVDPMVEKMGYPPDAVFKETKTVESPASITYSVGCIICTDFLDQGEGCFPQFFKILNLFHCSSLNECVALAQPFETLCWSRHFHAYRVKPVYALEAAEWVKLSTLEFPFPNTFCSARDGNDYIFMRNNTSHFTYART